MRRTDPVYIFAGDSLDRADQQRRDKDWLDARATDRESRFVVLWRGKVLTNLSNNPMLGWLNEPDKVGFTPTLEPVFLGIQDDIAHFGIDVSAIEDPKTLLAPECRLKFIDVRSIATELPTEQSGTLAHAKSLLDWHARHRFCANCGAKTDAHFGAKERICPKCGAHHFPRTDPVAIMVVYHGDKCLLGRSHHGSGVYSALAGFVDQGESIEEAVRREILEEARITVGAVRYHSSQPWPYPSSLMIGCIAEALNDHIVIDDVELADVAWFHRDEVAHALENPDEEGAGLKLPGRIAIAHHLLQAWLRESS